MAFMKIKPTDSLFFRGGKPFNAGADSWSDSSFLPHPSVIWGAMFSVLYKEDKIVKTKDKNGKTIVSNEERKKLQIKNIYLYQKENKVMNVLVQTPLDVFIDEYGKNYTSRVIKKDFLSNYELDYITVIDKDNVEVADKSFIDIDSLFEDYQKYFELSLYPFDKIFRQDYKIGIKIDKKSKTAEDTKLYRIDLTQFEEKTESGFLIEYELDGGENFEPKGILKLGGEGKTAKFEKFEDNNLVKDLEGYRNKALQNIKKIGYFKLYFKTPALLKCAWQPNKIKGLKLLSANVGKYISIGGFDMETNKPKKMQRFIPAGSVYVYNIEDKSIIDFRKVIEAEIKFEESYKGFGCFEILSVKEQLDG